MSKLNFDKKVVYHERSIDKGHTFGRYTGRTIAVLHVGTKRYVGISSCSKTDSFNKKRGYEIAVGRAISAMKCHLGRARDSFYTNIERGLVEVFDLSSRGVSDSQLNIPDFMVRSTPVDQAAGE